MMQRIMNGTKKTLTAEIFGREGTNGMHRRLHACKRLAALMIPASERRVDNSNFVKLFQDPDLVLHCNERLISSVRGSSSLCCRYTHTAMMDWDWRVAWSGSCCECAELFDRLRATSIEEKKNVCIQQMVGLRLGRNNDSNLADRF